MTVCLTCQRPSYLWSGATCDACTPDSNGNAVDDRREASYAATTPTLFPAEEKGWAMVGVTQHSWPVLDVERLRQEYRLRNEKGWQMVGAPRFEGNTKEKVREFIKQWHQSRACRWAEAEFRKHLRPDLREIGLPSA